MKNTIRNALFRTYLITMFMVFTASLFTRALAKPGGGIDSGGGGAFLCQNAFTVEEPGKSPDYVEAKSYFLDLWEAQFLRRWTVVRSNEDELVQLRRAFEKLRPFDSSLPDYLYNLALQMFVNKRALDSGIDLEPPRDANSHYKMKNCSLVGMMFYDQEEGGLIYDEQVFSLLASKTDIAAAMAHEAWYYFVRQQHTEMQGYLPLLPPLQKSTNSRKLIGCLFSTSETCLSPTQDEVDWEKNIRMKPTWKYECRGNNSLAIAYLEKSFAAGVSSGSFQLNFQQIQLRTFSRGLLGEVTFTYGPRFLSFEKSRLSSFDLSSLGDIPEVHGVYEVSNERRPDGTFFSELKSIYLLKPSQYLRRQAVFGEPPSYSPGELIDIMDCKIVP